MFDGFRCLVHDRSRPLTPDLAPVVFKDRIDVQDVVFCWFADKFKRKSDHMSSPPWHEYTQPLGR